MPEPAASPFLSELAADHGVNGLLFDGKQAPSEGAAEVEARSASRCCTLIDGKHSSDGAASSVVSASALPPPPTTASTAINNWFRSRRAPP